MLMSKMFLDGDLVDVETVAMPVLSRGFAFGFGVFETMKFLGRNPCFFREHLARLQKAVDAAGIKVALDETTLRGRARQLFDSEEVDDGVFKIVISDRADSTQVAMFVRRRGLNDEPAPVRLVSSAVRKASLAFTSRHKSLNYMESVLELEKANSKGFDECVFRNEYGQLTECAVANLFWVKDGVLRTPALECGLLDGIVRGKVLGWARDAGIEVQEGRFSESDLWGADEAFLTSSGNGPRSVASFLSSQGESKDYSVELLPRLRAAYLTLEREEALKDDE